jgi:hypothetical protein
LPKREQQTIIRINDQILTKTGRRIYMSLIKSVTRFFSWASPMSTATANTLNAYAKTDLATDFNVTGCIFAGFSHIGIVLITISKIITLEVENKILRNRINTDMTTLTQLGGEDNNEINHHLIQQTITSATQNLTEITHVTCPWWTLSLAQVGNLIVCGVFSSLAISSFV